jgi:hypothetical protein
MTNLGFSANGEAAFLAEIVRWDCTLFQHIGEGGRNFSGSVLTVDAGSTA